MKIDLLGPLAKRVPLALLAALLLQGASAIWWAAGKERDNFFLAQRVSSIESVQARASDVQGQMLERLARIEERENAQLSILDRMEKQLALSMR